MKSVHRVIRWFCVVSPPAWAVVLALSIFGFVEGLHRYALSLDAQLEAEKLGLGADGIVVMIVGFYALFRGFAFHPAYREDYLAWLALTPWRITKPLLLGPVQVVAQDLVMLGLCELMLWDAIWQLRILVPVVFFSVLIGCWALATWVVGYRTAAYEIAYALGTTVWIASFSPIAAGLCLLATLMLGQYRLRRSFDNFPWSYASFWYLPIVQSVSLKQRRSKQGSNYPGLGWVYDVLIPRRAEQLPLRDCLLLSGLVCLWSLAILSQGQETVFAYFVYSVTAPAAFGYCMKHFAGYVWNHAPPISLMGRLFTGRWIIPSYDVAFLPMLYFAGSLALTWLMVLDWSWSPVYVLPAMLMVYLLLMNLATPDVNRWRLTSQARLTPWYYSTVKGEFEQL